MRIRALSFAASILLATVGLTSCGGAGASNEAADVRLPGTGASFPFPIYSKWFKAYSEAHQNVEIDYQSTGSGSGVKSFIDKTVDFGASDKAMTPAEIKRAGGNVQLLPLTAGNIVLIYNMPGVKRLKLTRKAYVGIFLGTIKKWNDAAIAKANPEAKLPDSTINVVVRADSSGTTFVFTQHLSTISKAFAAKPGKNDMPAWSVGTRSKGNEGVTASIQTTPNSIGYVEYGYALIQKMPMAQLENKSGRFIAASKKARYTPALRRHCITRAYEGLFFHEQLLARSFPFLRRNDRWRFHDTSFNPAALSRYPGAMVFLSDCTKLTMAEPAISGVSSGPISFRNASSVWPLRAAYA